MFIGETLQNLRIMNGYSRKRLAKMIGVSEQAVWQYENYYISPKLPTINDLREIFAVRGTYFYRKDMLDLYTVRNNIPLMNIAYRSRVINVISKTQSEAKHMEYIDSFINYLTSDLSVPTDGIVRLRDKCVQYLNETNDSREEQIYQVARLARKSLGLDQWTNRNLMFLMEKSGLFIFEKTIGDEIDAYSLWTADNRAFIMLGNLKRSAVRRNFDLTHELGHLLLHYKVEFTNLDKQDYKEIEREADRFAGAFLLPKEAFKEEIQMIVRKTNPDAYIEMKEKWNVSIQVLGYRALHLGILSAREHRNFYTALHRKSYLKCEPLDEAIPIQRPQKMKSIFDLVIREGIIDFQKMLEVDWRIEVEFLSRLTGIDGEFFYNYITKSIRIDKNNVQVISY